MKLELEELLPALPLKAFPAKVLPRTLAFPDEALCEVVLLTDTSLLFETRVVEFFLTVMELFEPGPVLVIDA